MTDPLEGVIDAYLYEGTSMVYKETERRPDLVEKGYTETPIFYRKRSYKTASVEDLADAIEQHEAFRQEVSDAVGRAIDDCGHDGMRKAHISSRLDRFIIPKPDPLVEALDDLEDGRAGPTTESYAACLREAIEKRGGKIVWGEG